ncbi:MAG TPA: hypothetical protein VIG64_15080 [Actinomycetota bacterium]|jgi:hypothetical protein
MKKKVRLLVLVATLAMPLVWMPSAKACSCAPSDPRDTLHATEGAFAGTYVGREPTDPADPYADYDYIFDTDEVYKGDVGDPVRVRSASNGAACGLEYAEGQSVALFLERDGETWRSSLCYTVDPERLEEAARPFPAPNAKGAARLLIGGSFGEVRVLAVDARGRTAGYGYGDGDALHLSACPGGKKTSEVVDSFSTFRPFVDVRRIADLEVRRTIKGPRSWRKESANAVEARCVSADGGTVVFARRFGGDGDEGDLVLFSENGAKVIASGSLDAAGLGRRSAYVARGREIVRVDYDTGERRSVGRLPRAVSALAVEPGGGLIAGVFGASYQNDDPPAELFLMNGRSGRVQARHELERDDSGSGVLTWLDDDKLLFSRRFPNALVFGRDLDRTATLQDWFPIGSTAIRCKALGVGDGALVRSSACDGGGYQLVREFFSPVTYSILALPRDTKIDAPPKS